MNKSKRNRVYRFCAKVILVCIAVLVAQFLPGVSADMADLIKEWRVVFFSESLALWAFAASWLIKGETFLLDDEN